MSALLGVLSLTLLGVLSAPITASRWMRASNSTAADALRSLQTQARASLAAAESNATAGLSCSLATASVRRDWAKLSPSERKDFIRAVQCLMAAPSQSDPLLFPGVRNRFDDFAGQHINQTTTSHQTGNFLSWHRYFIYAYEAALRNECGYQGYLPYWNWFTHQDNLQASPVFDGSDTSMGGNGVFVAHNGSRGGSGSIFIPSADGGGCITSGPFASMTANLGPAGPAQSGLQPSACPLCYNPHCLVRDLSNDLASTWFTTPKLLNLTVGAASSSILAFQNELQQGHYAEGFPGLHAVAHFTIGGDVGALFSSPVDPVFYLLHSMLDQLYWIWQALHPAEAGNVAGTITFLNAPPSRDTTLDDMLSFDYLAQPARPISDVLNTLGASPLCYIYE